MYLKCPPGKINKLILYYNNIWCVRYGFEDLHSLNRFKAIFFQPPRMCPKSQANHMAGQRQPPWLSQCAEWNERSELQRKNKSLSHTISWCLILCSKGQNPENRSAEKSKGKVQNQAENQSQDQGETVQKPKLAAVELLTGLQTHGPADSHRWIGDASSRQSGDLLLLN